MEELFPGTYNQARVLHGLLAKSEIQYGVFQRIY